MLKGTEVVKTWCGFKSVRESRNLLTVSESFLRLSKRTGARRERFFRIFFMCSR